MHPALLANRRTRRWVVVAVVAAIVVVLVAALMLVTTVASIFVSSQAASSDTTTCDTSLAAPAGSAPVAGAVDSAAGLTADQRANAVTILQVGKEKQVPARGWLVAIATAMQESNLQNLDHGDRDSLGLFQQRPSMGWGTPEQVTDPVYAAGTFYERLVTVPGWETMEVTEAAQAVQASGFPDAYAKWEALALDVVRTLGEAAGDLAGLVPCSGRPGAPLSSETVGAAIRFAMDQIGKDYVWGATGPDTYDCSGLVKSAFAAAGIILPRVSRDQYGGGGHLPVAEAQPGDLLFWAYDRNDPATIHHVAMYLGDGQMIEAPYTGEQVRTRAVDWADEELVPLATRPGTSNGSPSP